MNWGSLPLGALRWLAHRKLEAALFGTGVVLRSSMWFNYKAGWAYDYQGHSELIAWIVEHGRVPPIDATFEAFHPPLYYAAAATLTALGVQAQDLMWLSIGAGCVRLALIWAGLELFLPASRVARLSALGLAAIIPVSIHLEGMNYPEAMSGMWNAAALLVAPFVFRSSGKSRLRWAALLGVLLGLAMLTKISATVLIASLGLAAVLEFLYSGVPWKTRSLRLLTWAGSITVCLAICGWYFARNVRDHGRPFVTSFELPSQRGLVAESNRKPYLDRRTAGYYVGWDSAVFSLPYYPTAIAPHPRFFPVALSSTFGDYWNYSFSSVEPAEPTGLVANSRALTPEVLQASRYSVAGGMVIMLASLAAWFGIVASVWRKRDFGLLALCIVPVATVGAALHFATAYPVDTFGVVKGAYLQFGAPPLFGIFGVAVAWAARQRLRWPLLFALLAAVWLVASYTLYCRLRIPILPLG